MALLHALPARVRVQRGAGPTLRPRPEVCSLGRHSPAVTAGWTAPRGAWSGCCDSPTGAPGQGRGEGLSRTVGRPRSPHLPPQRCPIQGALSHRGPVHFCNFRPSQTQTLLAHLPGWGTHSLSTSFAVVSNLLCDVCVLCSFSPPGQPHPQRPSLPAQSLLPASAGRPAPPAGSRGRCGLASAISG